MKDNIIKLAPDVKASESSKEECIALLERALERTRNGDFKGILVIPQRPDGSWSFEFSSDVTTLNMLGWLEIIKHEWITSYLADEAKS